MSKLIRWLFSVRSLVPLRRLAGRYIRRIIESRNGIVLYYEQPHTHKAIDVIMQIRSETELLINNYEGCWLFAMAGDTAKVNGDMAEVGVYKGGSAKLICEAKGNRTLHLFDTFEGLPMPNLTIDTDPYMLAGNFSAPAEVVIEYLSAYSNVYIHKGFFPNTANPIIEDKTFSFVHLDVDLWESTLNSLRFFYPRMNQGGVIVSHNYTNLAGVKKAFSEFFQVKPEIVIELLGSSQCLVVKL